MVEVRRSTIIDAPIDEVWAVLRDFNGHDRWHPAVAQSRIEGGAPGDAVGAVRQFRLADGSVLREQLLSMSDRDRSFSYCILEAPIPLMGYVATVALKPVTDGDRTFWEWRSSFHPPDNRRRELTELVSDQIYAAGMEAIRALLARKERGAATGADAAAMRPGGPPPAARMALPRPAGAASGAPTGPASATTTTAIVVDRYGGPEVLVPETIEVPAPGAGEIRIRHTAIGVNFIDIYCRTGYFDLLKPPGVPGMEAAGVVEAVGAGVTGFSVGDRVAYACPPVGAYCGLRVMAPDLVIPLPPDIADDVAAASLLKGVSASFLLHEVHRVEQGDTVLIHAGAGGIGQLLIQWARHLGATVIATASSDAKARIAEAAGAHRVVVYSREDFVEAVMRITAGRGVDVVYDAVGRDTIEGSMRVLAAPGHLVSYGQASGPVGEHDVGRLSSKSITLSRPNYGHYTDTPAKLGRHVDRLFDALRRGIIAVRPPTIYPLAEAASAHRDLESRTSSGALMLKPEPDAVLDAPVNALHRTHDSRRD